VKKAACPKDEMAWQCGKYVGEPEGKWSLRRPRHRWMDINYILKKQDGMT